MKTLILSFAIAAVLMGCASADGPTYEEAANNQLIQTDYGAADKLLGTLNSPLDKGVPIVVATVVNIDNLTNSSRLGRLISEHIATRLSQQGYAVIELKIRGNIFILQKEGELLLSREVKDITRSHNAQAVVVGTYARAAGIVYITLKIVGVEDNVVKASHNYVLPLNANIRALLPD